MEIRHTSMGDQSGPKDPVRDAREVAEAGSDVAVASDRVFPPAGYPGPFDRCAGASLGIVHLDLGMVEPGGRQCAAVRTGEEWGRWVSS